jgi:hypothetical protein
MSVLHARLSRRSAEIATALATGGLGATVVLGAIEFGVRWGDAGPEPGMFPFYVGLLIVGGSIGNLIQALRQHRPAAVFIDGLQARRVASFFGPMLLFVLASVWLGLYVATALYLILVMTLQGGYRLPMALTVGAGMSAFFYLVLEVWFKVPLLKGPIERWLGLG